MKRTLTILFAFCFAAALHAQVPEKMSYQAVVRGSDNELVKNTQIGMRISIVQGSVTGSVVYTETQNPTTNANGLVSIQFGGNEGFDAIDWSTGLYFLKTEIDINGGADYSIEGVSQLLSVPFALYAKTSGSSLPGMKGETGSIPKHEWSGTSLRFENPDGSWGAYVDLKGAQGVQGVQGIQGPKGDKGDKGEQGDRVTTPTFAVCANATTYGPGGISNIYYCNSGSCNCTNLLSKTTGNCTAKADTGSCSASNTSSSAGGLCTGACCVCRP